MAGQPNRGPKNVRGCLDTFRELGANAPPMEAGELNLNWQAWLQTSFAQHVDGVIGDGLVRAEVAYHPHLIDTRRKEKRFRKVEVLLYRVDGSRVRMYPQSRAHLLRDLEPFGVPLPEPKLGQQSKAAFLQSCCTTDNYMGWRQALACNSCALDAMMTLWFVHMGMCAHMAPISPERFPIWRFMSGVHHHALWLHPSPIQFNADRELLHVASVRDNFYPGFLARPDTTERPRSIAGHSTAGV